MQPIFAVLSQTCTIPVRRHITKKYKKLFLKKWQSPCRGSVAAFRLPKLPAGPPKFMKVLNSLKDMLHESEHLAHAKCMILRCVHQVSSNFRNFLKICTFSKTLVTLVLWPQNFPRHGACTAPRYISQLPFDNFSTKSTRWIASTGLFCITKLQIVV